MKKGEVMYWWINGNIRRVCKKIKRNGISYIPREETGDRNSVCTRNLLEDGET